ncbi:YVTN family beta-propeller repeat protein [Desulfitobacterium dichloroeliminans LMG P-21439]|uniref:YVTN family beta-propeller repeat protein n=1 Tax=Desulfitobacterium dichloroeliminans (strain LMG P-21439 / DCA1) TaxID=871963 RepID=L0F6B5_DESDL|nr:YncE family protein [Desulfitobacterium dichloroeliminans]AGA68727.1 YVTN family beta-propeller repeat protein [Desulfitobacterium dichloroeliminans LMG P-21439]
MTLTPLAWVSLSGIDPSLPGDVIAYHPDQEKIVGMIPVGIDPRYLAWFPAEDKIYVPNYGSDTISVILCNSLAVIKTISVGKGPHALVIDSIGHRGYVANSDDHSISIIDLHQDRVIATIPMDLKPLGLVLSGDGKRLYVTQHSSPSVSLIDTDTKQVVATYPLGSYPYNLALSPNKELLYIVLSGDNRVSVFDRELQNTIALIPVGANPQRIVHHPHRPLVYVANFGDNSISIISTSENRVLTTIPDIHGPRDLVLVPDGSKLWVTNDYQLTLIDTEDHTVENILYAPPSAQIRQGLAYGESSQELITQEASRHRSLRPSSFVTEKIYFKPPKPFDTTLHFQFPTPTAKAEGLVFANPEVKAHSVSILAIPQRPNYFHITFSFRIPIIVTYKDHLNQLLELHDTIHHVASAVEIHLTPSRVSENLNLKISTQSELIDKSRLTPDSLDLTLRTHLLSMQTVHFIK